MIKNTSKTFDSWVTDCDYCPSGLQIVGSLGDDLVGAIEVFSSPSALNKFLRKEWSQKLLEAPPRRRIGYLGGLEIPEAHRRMGFGRIVVQSMVRTSKDSKLSGIFLHSTPMALPFWRSLGWSGALIGHLDEYPDYFNFPLWRAI